MIQHIREELPFYMLILFWVAATVFAGPVIYALLPLSVFAMRSREMWPEMLFGFLMILILSDMNPGLVPMRKIKTAKYAYIIALALIFYQERARFMPQSKLFLLFAPFFAYSFFPLIFSGSPVVGIQKTISYALLYLVVPNYMLYNFRTWKWDFLRNLVYFVCLMLLTSLLLPYIQPWWAYVGGRFRGYFGNPNGLGIFSFLFFMLYSTVVHLKKDLFPRVIKLAIYGIILYFLIKSGSRTSLVATMIFFFFSRFFSISPFIGFMVFLIFLAGVELISSNIATIVAYFGLQKYFRVETLSDGSGRYFAWQFAWEKIQDFFLFGGGFGNDEYIMRQHYPYLRSQGHHGGVHNSYLTMWFNVGFIGVLIYFRSFFLMFLEANKRVPLAFGVMFAVLFSVLYESWLTGSLNPFTITLLMTMTMLTEPEFSEAAAKGDGPPLDDDDGQADEPEPPPMFRPIAR